MRLKIVAFEEGLAYGGPEEGGWWYGTSEKVRELGTIEVLDNEEKYRRMTKYNNLIRRLQRKLPSISSVGYSGGRYCVRAYPAHTRHIPQRTPECRPHYE